jgi:hypothetical protein
MNIEYHTIECYKAFSNTKRTTPFRVVVYTLNYQSDAFDKTLIDALLTKAEELASKVNQYGANNSTVIRPRTVILANSIAGVVSEYFWRQYLNRDNIYVSETEFTDSSTQIDLKVIHNNKKIEVRSSFPRNGIDFAICNPYHQFDILGPYHNSYKVGEIQKDYYVRTLFHLETPTDIIQKIKEDNFKIYLTGGATWEMMIDDRYAINKDLIPQDDLYGRARSTYRVVPFSKALDTGEIKMRIIS